MGSTEIAGDRDGDAGQVRLMISALLVPGQVHGEPVSIERNMPVLSRDGQEVGKVAAVAVGGRGEVDYILLSRLPAEVTYRVIPAGVVAGVNQEGVRLQLDGSAIEELEPWSAV